MTKALLIFVLFLSTSLISAKLLGHRTASNIPRKWKLAEPAPENYVISFTIALKQRNLDVLESTFWSVSDPDSPFYRRFLETDEIQAIVSPPQKDIDTVVAALRASGITYIESLGDALECKSTVAAAEKFFQTKFHKYINENGKVLVRAFGQFSVPNELSHLIDLVVGLSEFPVNPLKIKKNPIAPLALVSIVPASLNILYSIGSADVQYNSSVGVIEFEEQYYSPQDLSQFAQEMNLKISPLTPDHIIGTNDGNNPQTEATLDIEYALAVAPGATGWFWIEGESAWLYTFATHMLKTKDLPMVVSISYGWNEEDQCEDGIGGQECYQLGVDSRGYVTRVNVEFQKIGLRGVSIITASGDSGANGRTDGFCLQDHLNPVFPAASPYVTSVGATEISKASGVANLPNPPPACQGYACASGGKERCVSYDQSGFASGGGFSNVAPIPSYQAKAVQTYFGSNVKFPPASYFNKTGRGFPDVSALGSNVLILDDGQIEPVGGTSASSPIWAGVIALLNDYVNKQTGKPLGFLNPLLYKMAASDPTTFTDITEGNNVCTEDGCSSSCKGFYATAGWDPISGLGTPVFSRMLSWVQKNVLKKGF